MKLIGLATPHDMLDSARTEDKSAVKPGLPDNPDLPEPTVSTILSKSPPLAGSFVYEDPQKALVQAQVSQNVLIRARAVAREKGVRGTVELCVFPDTAQNTARHSRLGLCGHPRATKPSRARPNFDLPNLSRRPVKASLPRRPPPLHAGEDAPRTCADGFTQSTAKMRPKAGAPHGLDC
jgi:hypothetical protein